MIYGTPVGGVGLERTYILTDENGVEFPATFVDNETSFDATANDIRIGKVAATDYGITTGTKEIPAYHTTEGFKAIRAGGAYEITLQRYDYTKLQVIICQYNTSASNSVAAEIVSINDKVYAVGSTEELASVSVDSTYKKINLGITNDGDTSRVMRYFTYKEEN